MLCMCHVKHWSTFLSSVGHPAFLHLLAVLTPSSPILYSKSRGFGITKVPR